MMTGLRLVLVVILLSCVFTSAQEHTLLLRDEGMSKLSLVNLADPKADWQVEVPPGRDFQLVGKGLVLLGTANGYEEREIVSGKKVREITSWPGTVAARRLLNGNTMLIGVNWQDHDGIVLVEISSNNDRIKTIVIPGFTYARLFRQTKKGTYLITADKAIIEADDRGNITWHAEVPEHKAPHAWQALRLGTGETVVATGFQSTLQFYGVDGKPVRAIGGPVDAHPHFFAGFQILSNGNFVVTNWRGHGPSLGSQGTQLLEFDSKGNLVWSWKQDATKFSSLQGVIVLDGLDLNKLHVENDQGVLAPR